MNDKNIELNRFDSRAVQRMINDNYILTGRNLLYFQPPYLSYKQLLQSHNKDSKVLEIGAGMGENTGPLLEHGFNVCATDISPNSVDVMKRRFSNYSQFSSMVADMEKLPFNDESVDVVCAAGSLSYGENTIVMNEIYRVLKQGGAMIVVDSLNNNPIYRINRYVHYLRGNRSISTLKRIPTVNLIEEYTNKFGYAEVKYFGAITWLFPILSNILNEEKITILSNYIDRIFRIKKSAFKFTLMAIKK
jgi:ubiquinone/menaquinone biosynthesis C-methylase UbiE